MTRHVALGCLAIHLAMASLAHPCAAAEEIDLLKGPDFSGWEFISPGGSDITAVCKRQGDGVVAVAGRPIGYIATKQAYENYRLQVEWRWTEAPGNGGVLVHISSGPRYREWPTGFQLQTRHERVGDLLPMAGAAFAEPLTPDVSPAQLRRTGENSEKPAGEWNAAEIVCRGDRIECTVNGVRQNVVTGCTPKSGTIGFQLEGAPFEIRNVRLTRLE